MQTVSLGKTDIQLSAIVMGTWQAGRSMWADIDDAQTRQAVQDAFEAGITTFDTATVYGNGHSERIVGGALAHCRPEVVIATKVFSNRLRRDQVMAACEQSLRDLGTDYIDLYQIHWPPGSFGAETVPLSEPLEAMERLQAQGKIRAIGVSNFSRNQLAEAHRICPISSLQPPYSLFWRHHEAETMDFCRENNITVLAYSPMAQGLLTGKFGPEHRFAPGDHRAKNRLFQAPLYDRVQEALARLRPVAERLAVSPGQLALAWVVAHKNTCAIAGARNPEQVRQTAGAGDLVLDEAVMAELDRIGRVVTDHLDDDPVPWHF
jgi:aryl-alcohol dehydrogenase-like predicted oxidoreductase